MPIKEELRHFYDRRWRTETRPRILDREEHKCKWCKVPNHTHIRRLKKHPEIWVMTTDPEGRPRPELEPLLPLFGNLVRIVLTVAHLNHRAGDDRDENLAALCQRCHLVYDREHHSETRSSRKDDARPLLSQLTERPQW